METQLRFGSASSNALEDQLQYEVPPPMRWKTNFSMKCLLQSVGRPTSV
ncbi:MAG: hypothetical protein HXX18_14245 [Bacteroidetes bacterium]|nr:hypothetical protein [Bacteroidota bacterium]